MALISSASKSGRLLASRRYTHETLNDAQESFTNVLDLQATEIYTQAGYLPSSGLPFSGSTQINATHTVSGSSVLKYWYRHKLTKSNTNNETWFFLSPSGSDSGVGAQLINDNQEVNFVSPKYSIATLATTTTADSTPGYLATLYKSSAVSNSIQTGSLDGDDIVSTNDYIFDYKTGVVEFKNSSVDPTNSEYLYMTVYQYTGTTSATGIDVRGNVTGSDIYSTGTLDIDGATTLNSTLDVDGATTLNGTVTLGNATGDTITATGRFNTDIVPSTDSARDLGTSGLQFAEAHIDTGYIDSLTTTTNVDIDDSGGDGAMDGVIIGAATAVAGTFTTLNTTGLTTIGDASGDTLTINAATINPANIAAGTDNTVVVYNGSTLLTDEIDSKVWDGNLVDTDGSGANNELATWSDSDSIIGEGNLTFDGSTLAVTGAVTVSGNLEVNGTTTYISSSQVDIGDRIITLNAQSVAGDGGLYVNDASGNETGSLLWDVSANRWIGGLKDSEYNILYATGDSVVSSSAEGDAQGQMKFNGVNVDTNALGSGDSPTFGTITANTGIVPDANDGAYIGTTATGFSDLHLATGGVINWANGEITMTETADLLVIAGGNTRVDRLELDSAADYLDVSTDLQIIAAADITLNPGGNNVKPGGDSQDDLGVSGTAWRKLFVDDIELNSQGSITNAVSASIGYISGSGDMKIDGGATFGGGYGSTGTTISSAGVLQADGAITSGVGIKVPLGESETPSYSFTADPNTGMYSSGTDTLEFVTAGNVRLTLQQYGDAVFGGNLTVTNGITSGGGYGSTGTSISSAGVIQTDGAITAGGNVTAVGSFVIGSADMSETDLEKLDGITNGAGLANKALVLDGSADIVSGINNLLVSRLEIDADTNYIDVSTDLQIIAAADIKLDPAGGEVDVDGNLIPNSDSADDLGASGQAWNKLWVDDIDLNAQGSISIGGTGRIDLDADDDTSVRASADDVITFEAGAVDIAQMTSTMALSGSSVSTGSFGYLNVDGDAVIGGNLTFGDAATDSVSFGADITSNLIPDADATYNLGSSSQGWNDLFLGEGGVINWDNGDATLTQASNVVTLAGATLTGTLTNALSITANGGIGMTSYNASAAVSNLSLDIDGMTDIGAGLATGDIFAVDDGAGGTNRKVTIDGIAEFVSGSTFSKISGDVTITGAGVATVTGATTNAALTAGDGISAGGTFDGATARTFAIDLSEYSDVQIATGDKFLVLDSNNSTEQLESVDDLAAFISGSAFGKISGDITIAGTGVATIGANAIESDSYVDASIDFEHIQNVAANSILGRNANSSGVLSEIALATTQVLIGDGTGFTAAALSGDVTMTNAGVVSIGATKVTGAMLNDDAISGQGALGGASVAQADLLLMDDGPGTLKSVTFSNFEDSIFANISGDIAIAAGGAATVTGATTNAALTAGTGISAGGTFDGATARTFALDLSELSNAAVATGDRFATLDSDGSNEQLTTVDDLADYVSGSAFGKVSGDVSITGAGVATVTGATTNAALTAGTGISAGGTFDGATARTFALDLSELSSVAVASGDRLSTLDSDGSNEQLTTVDDLADYVSGSAFSKTSGDITIAGTGVTTIGATKVTGAMLNDDVISGQTNLGSAGVAQADEFMFSDAGTLKALTFSNLEDSIFANIGGDISIAAGGTATVTGATTNAALTAGSGLNNGGGTFDGATARTFSVDSGSMAAYYSGSAFGKVSGDITIAGTGVATIGANAIESDSYVDASIDFEHIQDVAANSILGRNANSSGVLSEIALATTQILIGDGTGFTAAALSGDVTMTNAGAVSIGATKVTGAMLNDDVISGQSALGSAAMAQADLLLIDDGPATVKKITFSNFEDSIFGNVSGDATIAAGGALTIAATSVENSMLVNEAVDSEELKAGAVDDAHLSDGVATGLAGAGLTDSGGVMAVGQGTGITVNANDIAIGQAIGTGDSPTFTGIIATSDVTIQGNLTVTGDRIEAQVGSLQVADHTITVGSGSTTSATMNQAGLDFGVSGSVAFLRYDHSTTMFSSSVDLKADQLHSTIATGTPPLTVSSTTEVANLNAAKLSAADWDAPLAIGGTTAAAGTFTTMTATTSVLGTLGGNVDHSNYNSTNVDIDSGDIASGVTINKSPVITLGGDLSGNVTLSALASGTLTATIASNAVQTGMVHDDVATELAGDGLQASSGVMAVDVSDFAGTGLSDEGSENLGIDATQTGITSILSTSLVVGRDADNQIDFGTDDMIKVEVAGQVDEFRFASGGTFHADADVVAYSSTTASDISLKKNITDTKYGLSDIMKLRGVDYDWKREDMGHDVGVLAQEVEAVIPEIVKEYDGLKGRPKFKAVDYNKLVPVLIESIKELKSEIDELKKNQN